MTPRPFLALSCALLALPSFASAQNSCPGQELYAMGPTGRVFLVNNFATNPVAIQVGDTGIAQVADIAFDPFTGDMYMNALATNGGLDFYRVDPATWSPTLIANTNQMGIQNALDFGGNGELYSHGPLSGIVWRLDPLTGVGVNLGDTGAGTQGDLAVDQDGTLLLSTLTGLIQVFDPQSSTTSILGNTGLGGIINGVEIDCDGEVWILLNNGELCTVNRSNAAPTPRGNIAMPNGEEVWGMAFTRPVDSLTLGSSYCLANVNSTGQIGVVVASGSQVVSDDDLTLTALRLPPNQFAYFIASQTQSFVPGPGGSQGNLCMGGTIARYNMLIGQSSAAGSFAVTVGTQAVPLNPNAPMVAGQTWNFQLWHRDLNPMPTSNFTQGLSVPFN